MDGDGRTYLSSTPAGGSLLGVQSDAGSKDQQEMGLIKKKITYRGQVLQSLLTGSFILCPITLFKTCRQRIRRVL